MPPVKAAFDGIVALTSLVVMAIVGVVLTTFQFTSTAFTVTLNELPATCAVGVPVFPLKVPGAAVSPGINTCSLLARPAPTVISGLVLAVLVLSVILLAVRVLNPEVFRVTLNVPVPPLKAASDGNVALTSFEVILTVLVEETTFQFASTAFTVTLN